MMYLRTAFASFALVFFAYIGAELAIDEFGVYGTHGDRPVCVPNARVIKLRHLAHDQEPVAFVLGSSRANYYSTETLERLSGKEYYNLSSPMENALGMERWVHWLLAHRQVRQVVLTLDFDLQEHPYNPADPFIRDPPELTGDPRAVFLLQYAITPPDQLAACLRAQLQGSSYWFDPATGQDGNHGRTPMRYPPVNFLPFAGKRQDASTQRLAAMVGALRARGVDVRVVVNPIWTGRFQTFNQSTYERWLRNVVRVTGGVWDFSGVNDVTVNLGSYYEDVHFTEPVGDRVLRTVFRGHSDGFGVFVDAHNVDRRIAELRRDFDYLARTARDPHRSPRGRAGTAVDGDLDRRSTTASD